MSALFSPLSLKHFTLKNRLVVSPMCQYSATDGFANNWHLVHLGQFASGGAAVIIQEATAVSPEGRISYGDLGIWKDEHITQLKEITTFIKANKSIPGIQLAHAGRKASTGKPWIYPHQIAPDQENGWQTVAPSAVAFHPEKDSLPRALTIAEIKNIIADFKNAAIRAVEAGYEIIEIHGAHGYLVHQFLSPLCNTRTDEYGGSFENRIRFLLETIAAIKEVLTTQSLWLRLSATDWAEGGWDLAQSIRLTTQLKALGIEVLDISTAGAVSYQQVPIAPNYQLPFASSIKEQSHLITGTVGLIKDATHAEAIIKQQQADLIFMGRAFLKDPHLPLHFAEELNVAIQWPDQYLRAKLS